jgi:malate synthase
VAARLGNLGPKWVYGARAAVRTVIRYRCGYLMGGGAALLDGYMEDLATERIYRLMIAQRPLRGMHIPADITRFFDEEVAQTAVLVKARRVSSVAQQPRRSRTQHN